MGWEWHDRERDGRGRFARGNRNKQLHLYCYPYQAEAIRAAAAAHQQEVSAFCLGAIMSAVKEPVNGEKVCINGDPQVNAWQQQAQECAKHWLEGLGG